MKGMMANRKLSRAISDIGLFEFRRQLEYKSAIFGTKVIVANRWYPSSKTCCECGWIKKDLTLRDRVFECDSCGNVRDRDDNASQNLLSLGLRDDDCGQFDNPDGSNFIGAELVEAVTNQCPPVDTF